MAKATPKPLDLLMIDLPAFNVEQLSDLTIAIPAILLRQPDQSQSQGIIVSGCRTILQGAPRQSYHPARPSLRRREHLARMNDRLTELLWRQALGFRWFRLSLRINLSSSNSATIFFSRVFSF